MPMKGWTVFYKFNSYYLIIYHYYIVLPIILVPGHENSNEQLNQVVLFFLQQTYSKLNIILTFWIKCAY